MGHKLETCNHLISQPKKEKICKQHLYEMLYTAQHLEDFYMWLADTEKFN